MPFIVMCRKECPKNNLCFRFMSEPDEDQLYADFPALCCEENGYQMFMKIRKNDKVRIEESKEEIIEIEIKELTEFIKEE